MELPINQILCGNSIEVMKTFPSETVDMVMFSPPYWGLRDYGVEGQIGLEEHPQMYVAHMVEVCREVKRVLKKQGSMYIVLGDTYCSTGGKQVLQTKKASYGLAGVDQPNRAHHFKNDNWLQPKQKLLIPSRVAMALQEDGWILRNNIIWHKPNHMPSSVKDRLTNAYEHIFFFAKSKRYYYDLDAIREPHKRDWSKENWAKCLTEGISKKCARTFIPKYGETNVHRGNKSIAETYNPLGKNPGDIISERVKANIDHFREKGSGGNFDFGGLDSKESKHEHPLGKNPADVIHHSPETRRLGAIVGRSGAVKVPGGKGWVGHPPGGGARILREQDPRWLSPGGKNPADFWSINTKPFKGAHFAVYPEAICERPIKASCPPSGVILDPMCGSGTTCVVAQKLGRRWIGIELNREYVEIAKKRLSKCSQKLSSF